MRVISMPQALRTDIFSARFTRSGDSLFHIQVFAGAIEADQHRQVYAGDDFDPAGLEQRDSQIGGRSAKKIGEDYSAFAGINLFNGRSYFIAAGLHVVMRTNANGGDVFLGANNMLERDEKLGGKLAMCD
jgi:hypothetical protein